LADFDTEVEAQQPEVAHLECLHHLGLECRHFLLVGAGDDQVVDVDADEQDCPPAVPPVHDSLVKTLLEAHLLECCIQLLVLGPRRLAQAVERLAQAVHLVFFPGDGESRRLPHVDFLLQIAIEEGRLHVHVVDRPPFLSCQREDPDRLHARHWRKRVIIFDPLLLNEPARHQARLVLGHRAPLILSK